MFSFLADGQPSCAHHADRGPQAARDLQLVGPHDVAGDLLPVVTWRGHDGGHSGQPSSLLKPWKENSQSHFFVTKTVLPSVLYHQRWEVTKYK